MAAPTKKKVRCSVDQNKLSAKGRDAQAELVRHLSKTGVLDHHLLKPAGDLVGPIARNTRTVEQVPNYECLMYSGVASEHHLSSY